MYTLIISQNLPHNELFFQETFQRKNGEMLYGISVFVCVNVYCINVSFIIIYKIGLRVRKIGYLLCFVT
jgi:hypothetical protein